MQKPMRDLDQLLYNMSNPKPGRRGNPRMNRAVELRLNKPEMTLLEALCAAGFVFSSPTQPAGERGGHNDEEIFDVDGVSLSKRKNQLSKRLWQAKQRFSTECTNERIEEEPIVRIQQLSFMSLSMKSNHRVSRYLFQQNASHNMKPVHQDDFNLKFGNKLEKTNVPSDKKLFFSDELTSHRDSQRVANTKGSAPQEIQCPFNRMFTEDKGETYNSKQGNKRPLDDDDDNDSFVAMIDSVFDDVTTSFGGKQESEDLCRENKIQKRDQDFQTKPINVMGYQDNAMKMQKALGFYRSELGTIIEESMLEAGITPDGTKPGSLQHAKFVEYATKLTFQRIEKCAI